MTASNAFGGKDVNVLLYLARAWYALANRESNFSAMNKALDYCQEVSHGFPLTFVKQLIPLSGHAYPPRRSCHSLQHCHDPAKSR